MSFRPKLENGLTITKKWQYFKEDGTVAGTIDLMIIDPIDKVMYLFDERPGDIPRHRGLARQNLRTAQEALSKALSYQYTIKTYFAYKDAELTKYEEFFWNVSSDDPMFA